MRSMELARHHLATLRGRLVAAAALIIFLIAGATYTGYHTVGEMSRETGDRLDELRESTRLATELDSRILEQTIVAGWYLMRPEPQMREQFVELGREAHHLRQRYTELEHLGVSELTRAESVDALLSQVEVEYSLAHALQDMGRSGEAIARMNGTLPTLTRLNDAVRELSETEMRKAETARADLISLADSRQNWLLVSLFGSLGVGITTLLLMGRAVDRPIRLLGGAAARLGEKDLRVRVEGRMLSEYQSVADTFNRTAEQLREIVSETVQISDRISDSASDLSGISEQVSASSEEVASAMAEITDGAESQAQGLRSTEEALGKVSARTSEMGDASNSVAEISRHIHEVATDSRTHVSSALTLLLEVRGVVTNSSREVTELEQSFARIDQFVETISGIARQTNLLALNAAIEAARAGEHGRGFAVVADEVRKLAEGAARGAREVNESVETVRARIEDVAATMDDGTRKVADVEEVSRGANAAFEQIIAAAEEVRSAAERVSDTAARNDEAMKGVDASLAEVLGTAESHAASAQEVSAAAEEQSASTEELAAASVQLLASAERMKELVSGFQT